MNNWIFTEDAWHVCLCRYGMCKEVIKDMELTGTQGRFFYTTNRELLLFDHLYIKINCLISRLKPI